MNGMQGTAVGLVIGAGVAAGIAALALGGSDPNLTGGAALTPGAGAAALAPEALEQLKADAARVPELERELEAAKAQAAAGAGDAAGANAAAIEQLKAEILVLKNERTALQQELAAAKASAGAAAAAPTPKPGTFRFGIKDDSPIFAKQNWAELGGHVHAMLGDLPEFAKGMIETGKPDMEIMKRLAPHNQPLASLTMTAQGEIEGTGFNGPFTHPAVMANLLRGALDSAGQPLTEAQLQAIAARGAEWSRMWEQTKAGHTEETLALVKIADEVDAKQQFLDAVRALLTPEQLAIVAPETTRDRLQLDLFSPVFVWQMRQARTATDRASLKAQLLEALLGEAKAEAMPAAELDDVAERWLQTYGDAWLAAVPVRGWDVIFVTNQRLQAAARGQAAAAQELLARGQLTPEQATALRAHSTLYTPYIVQAK